MKRSRAVLAIAVLAAALVAAFASGVLRPRDSAPRRPGSAPRSAAAETPETSPPREETHRAAIPIALRSAATGEPIRGGRIDATAKDSGAVVSATTDEDGKILVTSAGRHRIVARARGFVGLAIERNVSEPGLTLALDPAGDLTLRFLDEDEEPVPGVVARLRDPAAASDAAERRSADEGTIRWLDLAPSGAYRWQLVSAPVTVDVVPTHEARAFELTESGVRGGGAPPPDELSGPIAVEAGRETVVIVPAYARSAVFGRVDGGPGAKVKLDQLARYENDAGVMAGRVLPEGRTTAGAGGAFRFQGVRPGQKCVRATWTENDGFRSFFFAGAAFDLARGEKRDLGTLSALPFERVEGIVRLEDERGRPLDPMEVFGRDAAIPQLALHLTSARSPIDARLAPAVFDEVSARLGELFVLHGIPRGSLHLQVGEIDAWPRAVAPDVTVRAPSVLAFSVPPEEPFVVSIVAEKQATATLRIRYPSGMAPFRCTAHLRAKTLGRFHRLEVQVPRDAGAVEAVERIAMPADEYEILVHSMSLSEPGSDASYFAEADFVLSSDGVAVGDLALEPGARVTGTALDPGGRPTGGRFLAFTLAPWSDAPSPEWVYKTHSDAEGRFLLRGLPPSRLVTPQFSADRFESPRPGAEKDVAIRLER